MVPRPPSRRPDTSPADRGAPVRATRAAASAGPTGAATAAAPSAATHAASASSPSFDDLLALGHLGAPHGLGGEFRLTLFVEPDHPGLDLIDPKVAGDAARVFLGFRDRPAEGVVAERVASLREGSSGLIIGLASIADRTAAEQAPRWELLLERSRLRDVLDEETYLGEDLIGFRVERADGTPVGRVVATREGVAQDLLIIEGAEVEGRRGRRFPVPFVAALVPEVDVAGRRLVVDLPPGLEEL